MKSVSFNKNWTCNGKPVTLPHDAQITEKRGPNVSNGGHGYFPGGIYTYEKTFTAPTEWERKDILIEFEGVYKNAAVILNGRELCFHAYGYTGFFVELEELAYGAENTLTVVADNSKLPNSRWYSGAGIYRPVWLHVCEKGGLRPESVKISTVSIDPAVIKVESPVSITAEVDDIAGEGTSFELTIPDAKLWSAEEPNLYTAKITAGEGDTLEIPFGVRNITWSNKGLFINGKETLLRGGCVHHDSGILGSATYAESEERRVRILKENGFNAIRSAHNPASKAMLDACDRLGMYVM
ncbi:MAG: glycoside hydrolase family 2 protein, partial [Oscillospiraceae bacterium]|nr:glycoside hydrolase family 2 protein [Oscillospiraceae bacterium]